MTSFTDEDLAAWAERKRVRGHLTDGRADPAKVHLRRAQLHVRAGGRRPLPHARGHAMSLTATLVPVGYGDAVAEHGIEVWPAAGHALLDELAAARGRLALVAAVTGDADELVDRLHADLGLNVARLGPALVGNPRPPSVADVEHACDSANLITDIDALMWPDMHVSPLQLLTTLARRRPTIAVWPGGVAGGRATYSTPGRPDHHDIALRDAIVLRPRSTRFPDEVPFTIERILP